MIQPAPVPQEVPLAKDADVQTGKLGIDTMGPAWCEQASRACHIVNVEQPHHFCNLTCKRTEVTLPLGHFSL